METIELQPTHTTFLLKKAFGNKIVLTIGPTKMNFFRFRFFNFLFVAKNRGRKMILVAMYDIFSNSHHFFSKIV